MSAYSLQLTRRFDDKENFNLPIAWEIPSLIDTAISLMRKEGSSYGASMESQGCCWDTRRHEAMEKQIRQRLSSSRVRQAPISPRYQMTCRTKFPPEWYRILCLLSHVASSHSYWCSYLGNLLNFLSRNHIIWSL